MTPEEAMRRALAVARTGLGRTFPNPSVGAVVFRRSGTLGVGRTHPPPGPHAEVVALSRASHGRRSLRGASIATTLEPCCFSGRTGPCTRALIEAGIKRVYIGCRDPHPRVAGRGLRQLRAAGIAVEVGLLGEECRDLHRGFFSAWERGRPFVTLKLAASLDGRIATASGESQWITGPNARRFTHRLRARVDGVLVGSDTALADDPALTARSGTRVVHRPVRVLLDGRLRVPLRARLYRGVGGATSDRVLVLTRRGVRGAAARRKAGVEVLEVRGRGTHVDLARALECVRQAGLTTLLVEGGGGLAAALLRANLVDEIHWLQAPILLGGDGRPAIGPLELDSLREAIQLSTARRRMLGRDLHWVARIGGAPRLRGSTDSARDDGAR